MGDIDLVRGFGLAGIASVCVGPPDAPARFSRHAEAMLPCVGHRVRRMGAGASGRG